MQARPQQEVASGSQAGLGGLSRLDQAGAYHPQPRIVERRLGVLGERCAARKYPPVIEHVRQVQDRPLPAVGRPQYEVVVLDPVQAGTQAAQPPQQVEADGEEVVHIVLGEQALTVERRLEPGGRTAADCVDRVLVGIDRGDVVTAGEGGGHKGQGVGRQQVVMVEEGGDLAVRQGQGGIGGRGDALRRLVTDDPDALVPGGGLAQDPAHFLGRGAIVTDAQPPVGVDLIAHRLDRRPEMSRSGIVHRHQHRDARQGGRALQPGADGRGVAGSGLVAGDPGPIGPVAGLAGAAFDRRPGGLERVGQAHPAFAKPAHQPAAADRPDLQPVRKPFAVIRAVDPGPGRVAANGDQARTAMTDLRGGHDSAAVVEGDGDPAEARRGDHHPFGPDRHRPPPGLGPDLPHG